MKLTPTGALATTTIAAFFFGSLLRGSAQENLPVPSVPVPAPEKDIAFSATRTGCTWKLSDDNNTIYLAGSVHLLREEDYPLPKVLDIAYEDSDRLVFEIDMAEMENPMAAAMKMQKLGMLPPEESLSEIYSEETWEKAKAYFWQNLVPAAIIDRMKPGMAFLTLSSLEAQKVGAVPELGVEAQFYQRSVVDEKPSSGLETIEYQLSRFDELTYEEHEELMSQTLAEIGTLPDTIGQIINAWHSGDLKNLDLLLNEQMKEEERLRELLLIERNENWIPHIEEAIAGDENVMFIVGAAHLVGEGSVIDLLEKKGYQPELLTETVEVKAAPSN